MSGDNPLAYAQDISLFEEREVHESIWDIKKRVVFLSPEMLRGKSQLICIDGRNGTLQQRGIEHDSHHDEILALNIWLN